nr:hypothetical protein GCM10020093_064750 [Planobispora longispora]
MLKRTVKEFQQDKLTDWAAALTYYAVLSIFPALLAMVSLLGLFGKTAIDSLIENLEALPSSPATQIIGSFLENLRGASPAPGSP